MKAFNILRSFLFIVIIASLQACEKDVSDKLKLETSQQLVVISFLSPQDSALHVKLQKTQPAIGKSFSEEELKIKNAEVKLSEGGQTISLKYDNRQDVYRAKKTDLPIVAGKTYSLQVATPNGWKATATSTVPTTTGISLTSHEILIENYTPFEGFSNLRHTLSFTWQDAPGKKNYYRVGAFRTAPNPNPNNAGFPIQNSYGYISEIDIFSTDEGRDGAEITSTELVSYSQNPDEFPRPYSLHLLLTVTDQAYYLYHRSIIQQRETGDNPFAEPTLLYTNINGGLGVFATYNHIHEVRQISQ